MSVVREKEDRKSEARGQQNVSADRNVIYVTLTIARSFTFFSPPFFRGLVLPLSHYEIRYLARNKIEPFEKAAHTFGSSYISMASTPDRCVGERTNNTADFKRSYVYIHTPMELYFQHLLFLFLPSHSSLLEIENTGNIRTYDSSRD